MNEKEKLNYLLRTLPSSLSHIGDLIDVLPEGDQTVDYVINKIKMYEDKEKDENINTKNKTENSNVFKSEMRKDRTCYKCGKPGHIQYECTRQSNAGTSWRGSRGRGQQQARRGAGQRGRGGQQRQDHQSANQGRMSFSTEVENRVGHKLEF